MDQGIRKPELQTLVQVKDRMTFLYIEHCTVNRQDGAITVTDARGTAFIPAAALSVLLIGPGTNLTHRAVELIGDSGMMLLWVGEGGVRYYAHGRPLTHSSLLLKKQAALVSNTRSRLAVARKMYQMRFPQEDVAGFTMQQLRGREGARVREIYRKMAKETGVKWNGREYDPKDFKAGNAINMALSAAHVCLYGIAHSAIAALGCSPGLGFVHDGHERSFVYDIADLYKAEISIPIAFYAAADAPVDIAADVRRRVRDAAMREHVLERVVCDIRKLLAGDDADGSEFSADVLYLWDERTERVAAGIAYDKFAHAAEALSETGYGKFVEG